jgi:hypothetical protein
MKLTPLVFHQGILTGTSRMCALFLFVVIYIERIHCFFQSFFH